MSFLRSYKPNDVSDQELIHQFKSNGNKDPLGILFNRYVTLVYGLCMKYLKNPDKAQDAVMEIYESLNTKLRKYEVENFKSWLYTLTRNHCFEILRKQNRTLTKEFDAGLMYSEEIFHPDDVTQEEALAQMEKCLHLLSKDQRDCIKYFYLENKSYNDIVELLNFNWNQIRSFIQNGRRNLKNCMEKNGFK